MRIEKLNENKIRIFLNLEDLQEKNIDVHTLMSSSIESQDLFFDMLHKAETEIGFITHDYKLIIEALASSDGSFIFTITRIKPDSSQSQKLYSPKVKRQSIVPNKVLSIFKFNNFEDFCEFCNHIKENSYIKNLKSSSLISFNGTYYLVLNNLKLKIADLKNFSYTISEFATSMKNEGLLERKLKEYGKIIVAKNAIETCLKYFN